MYHHRGSDLIRRQRVRIHPSPTITLEHLGKLGTHEGLEARFSAAGDATNHVSLSVFRFDDEALVTPHLARLVGHDSPLLHLRRFGDSGMFARFGDHAEELWSRGVPVVPASVTGA